MARLQTDEEREKIKEFYEKTEIGLSKGHLYDETKDYMKKQERIDLKDYNYNFEQYREYKRTYDVAKELDD